MPRPGACDGAVAVLDAHARLRDQVQLRDVFQPAAVGHRAAQRHVDLHQEVRADRHVVGLGHVRHLQPRRDAADAAHVHLHHRAGVALQIVLNCDRLYSDSPTAIGTVVEADSRRCACTSSAWIGSSSQAMSSGSKARAADRLGHRKALVGVHHDVPVVAHGLAHGGDARHVLGHMGPPDLELGAMKAFRPGLHRASTSASVGRCSQPPSVV